MSKMKGLEHRTAKEQAIANLQNAIRCLEIDDKEAANMCPNPRIVALAEIANAQMYLKG